MRVLKLMCISSFELHLLQLIFFYVVKVVPSNVESQKSHSSISKGKVMVNIHVCFNVAMN